LQLRGCADNENETGKAGVTMLKIKEKEVAYKDDRYRLQPQNSLRNSQRMKWCPVDAIFGIKMTDIGCNFKTH
jgi:hypothetical protein